MPQVLKDNCVIEDNWMVVDESAETIPEGDILLSYDQWQQYSDDLSSHKGDLGVIIEGNAEIEDIVEPLLNLPLIAINFPKFADGRGFSVARLLRERHNYQGEIRAVGGFIRDQLYLLSRCGFNAFKFSDDADITQGCKLTKGFH